MDDVHFVFDRHCRCNARYGIDSVLCPFAFAVRREFVRESTDSATAPTKHWAMTEVLGRGRYGSVHLTVNLE